MCDVINRSLYILFGNIERVIKTLFGYFFRQKMLSPSCNAYVGMDLVS